MIKPISKPEPVFIDAQEMAKKHPKTFDAPSWSVLDTLNKGDYVKVCPEHERFWVIIDEVKGNKIKGTVDNDLVCTEDHGIRLGDKLEFEKRHVYQVMRGGS